MGKGFPVVMSDEFQLFCYGLDFLDCSWAAVRCGGACGGGLSVGQSSHRRPAPWFVFEDGRAKIGRRSLK